MWFWFTKLGRVMWTKRWVFRAENGGNSTRCNLPVRLSLFLYLIFKRLIITDVNCVFPLLLLTLLRYVQSPQLGKLPGAWSLTTFEHHMLFVFAGTAARYRLIGTWARVYEARWLPWTLNHKGLHKNRETVGVQVSLLYDTCRICFWTASWC